MSKFHVSIGGKDIDVIVGPHGIEVLPDSVPMTIQRVGQHTFSLIHNGKSCKIIASLSSDGTYHVLTGSLPLEVAVESERVQLLKRYAPATSAGRGLNEITAPMPALVAKVLVNVGDEVAPGQGLVVLEAMKMENEIKAHQSGKIKAINVQKGMTVSKGDLLIMLE